MKEFNIPVPSCSIYCYAAYIADISKMFTNIMKVIYLDVSKENINISKLFVKLSVNIAKLR